jgi:hypothetical protein
MNPDALFERFLSPAERTLATAELASLGARAIPILELLFSGEAKNAAGVSYRLLGSPLDCALVAAGRLGPLAKPLEPYIREALDSGHIYAVEALRFLGALEEKTIEVLVEKLVGSDSLLSGESAATLVRCGAVNHPAVREVERTSPHAAKNMLWASKYFEPKEE